MILCYLRGSGSAFVKQFRNRQNETDPGTLVGAETLIIRREKNRVIRVPVPENFVVWFRLPAADGVHAQGLHKLACLRQVQGIV